MSKKGIVIAVPKKYEALCISNIQNIRKLGCRLPIEIWEIGKEISDDARSVIAKFDNVTFRNVEDFCDNAAHWKGFQIKAFVFYHTRFSEVLLCDGDVIVHQNPELLFADAQYLAQGAYFFRDLEKWQFSKLTNRWTQFRQRFGGKKFKSATFFNKRKAWLLSLIPQQTELFPKEWAYIYQAQTPSNPVKEALMESGIVLMNKETHRKSVQNIYDLNNNHAETYQYIWGDKETFWIACVMANEPFYFNPTAGYMSTQNKRLTHDYCGHPFFSQKG